MTIPPFETRAIAFLDILGFKNLISNAEMNRSKLRDLFGLRTTLDNHVRFDNQTISASVPEKMKPLYLFVSDSIIISSPLSGNGLDGLSIVVAKTIEISHKLLEMGFLLRGGISVGSAWHDDRNIFGTGYIEAYETEKKACYPCVKLTQLAADHWGSTSVSGMKLSESSMCVGYEEMLVVDTLLPFYIRGTEHHGRIEDAFKQYRAWICSRLQEMQPGTKQRDKWEWMAKFFDFTLKRHRIDSVSPIQMPPLPA